MDVPENTEQVFVLFLLVFIILETCWKVLSQMEAVSCRSKDAFVILFIVVYRI